MKLPMKNNKRKSPGCFYTCGEMALACSTVLELKTGDVAYFIEQAIKYGKLLDSCRQADSETVIKKAVPDIATYVEDSVMDLC